MPDVYISRAGMEPQALDEKFTQTELGTVKDDLAQIEQAAKIKNDQIHQLEESLRRLRQNLDAVSKVLSPKPTATEIEAAMRRKGHGLAAG